MLKKVKGAYEFTIVLHEDDVRQIALQQVPETWLQRAIDRELDKLKRRVQRSWNERLMIEVSNIPTNTKAWLTLVENKKKEQGDENNSE